MVEIQGIKYLSEKEAAALTGFSSEWLRKKRYKNEISTYIKIKGSKKILYKKDTFEIWLKSMIESFN